MHKSLNECIAWHIHLCIETFSGDLTTKLYTTGSRAQVHSNVHIHQIDFYSEEFELMSHFMPVTSLNDFLLNVYWYPVAWLPVARPCIRRPADYVVVLLRQVIPVAHNGIGTFTHTYGIRVGPYPLLQLLLLFTITTITITITTSEVCKGVRRWFTVYCGLWVVYSG
jgi:hypothetical protein